MAQPGTPPIVGVIGRIYEIDGLENRRWVKVGSPFGDPLLGALENARIAVPATRDPAAPARLNAVAGRVLRRQAS